MFSDGLNPAKGSAVRGLKNHLFFFFARRGKNEKENIKLYNGFSLLQVRLGKDVGGFAGLSPCVAAPGGVETSASPCMLVACYSNVLRVNAVSCHFLQFKGGFGARLTVSMRLIQSHLHSLSPPSLFILHNLAP